MKKVRALIPHPTDPGLVLVPLTRGYFSTISAVDAHEVGRFNWQAQIRGTDTPYAVRAPSRHRKQTMHAFLAARMAFPDGLLADHINGNGLDNRRSNLRPATASQNNCNARLSSRNSSGVKGVTWHVGVRKWQAAVRLAGKTHYVGIFDSLDDAAQAVAAAREQIHGPFANHGN